MMIITNDPSEDKEEYLWRHGWHFSPGAARHAAKLMWRRDAKGGAAGVEPFTVEEVDALLTAQGVRLTRSEGCDRLHVANMAKADYWKSSIEDEKHLALFIKDTIDDPDAPEGHVFRRWLADLEALGEAAEWGEWL